MWLTLLLLRKLCCDYSCMSFSLDCTYLSCLAWHVSETERTLDYWMNSERKSSLLLLLFTVQPQWMLPLFLIQQQEARDLWTWAPQAAYLIRYKAAAAMRLKFLHFNFDFMGQHDCSRISLKPCDLGLEQMGENELKLEGIFQAHNPDTAKEIPWHRSSHSSWVSGIYLLMSFHHFVFVFSQWSGLLISWH